MGFRLVFSFSGPQETHISMTYDDIDSSLSLYILVPLASALYSSSQAVGSPVA